MKKIWKNPQIQIERFDVDDYVATCCYIACDKAEWVPTGANDKMHSKRENGTGCGWEHSQSYTVLDGDLTQGATISMRELNASINGQYQGDIECAFSRDGRQKTLSNIKQNDPITWYTYYGPWTGWEAHTGIVKYVDDSHPNRS